MSISAKDSAAKRLMVVQMLRLTMTPDDYLIINDNIVLEIDRVAGGRAYISVYADRNIPVVRGEVFEKNGGERPGCLKPPLRKKRRYQRDQTFFWNDDRERAVRKMHKIMDHLEQAGSVKETQALRKLLDCIIPKYWEEEAGK